MAPVRARPTAPPSRPIAVLHRRWDLRTCLVIALLLAAAYTTPGASAQDVPCVGCSFEASLVDQNRTTPPGEFGRATIRIDNTGQFEDSYTIAVTSSDAAWLAEADRDAVGPVPPGSGPLANAGNSTTFDVSYVAPLEGRAGESTTIMVRVTSQGMDDGAPEEERVRTVTFTVQVAAVHRWALECDGEVVLAKAREAQVRFLVENRGNAPGTVTIRHETNENVVVTAPDADAYRVGVGERANGTYTVGASLRLQDGEVPFDLEAVLDDGTANETSVAACTTTLEVIAGDTSGPDDDGDGPGPAPESSGLTVLWPTLLLVALARGRHRSATTPRPQEVPTTCSPMRRSLDDGGSP